MKRKQGRKMNKKQGRKCSILCRFLCVAATAVSGLSMAAQYPQIVAHRGYWKAPGSAQNSIRALELADSALIDAVELDVWLTADDVLVVNHDADIGGVHIESAPFDSLAHVRLANGESLPTMAEYMRRAKQLSIPLVIELKPHTSQEREAKAADMIMQMVDELELNRRVTYISFSNHAVKYLAERSGRPVQALTSMEPSKAKALGADGVDFYFGSFKKHPEWIEEAHQLGMLVNIWTVNREEDLQWCIEHGADMITTNEPMLARQLMLLR